MRCLVLMVIDNWFARHQHLHVQVVKFNCIGTVWLVGRRWPFVGLFSRRTDQQGASYLVDSRLWKRGRWRDSLSSGTGLPIPCCDDHARTTSHTMAEQRFLANW